MKLGEKLMFGFAVLIAVAAVAKGVRQFTATEPRKPRDFYVWTEDGLEGHAVYRSMGCNSCHRALGGWGDRRCPGARRGGNPQDQGVARGLFPGSGLAGGRAPPTTAVWVRTFVCSTNENVNWWSPFSPA